MPETASPKRKRGADDGAGETKSPTPHPQTMGANEIAHRRRLELLAKSIPQITNQCLVLRYPSPDSQIEWEQPKAYCPLPVTFYGTDYSPHFLQETCEVKLYIPSAAFADGGPDDIDLQVLENTVGDWVYETGNRYPIEVFTYDVKPKVDESALAPAPDDSVDEPKHKIAKTSRAADNKGKGPATAHK
ncbi:uncharacterized protein LOC62_03G003611 [Vanrija pseudolonga]|uniref:Uncharacterized protein n=1 Tax=Vanrija pseudolonga TaxID=143232 RepID=A0AAF1BJP3_9TREE|nr:hypothetical protein LOC62_03G003611 [Vanrija pseudolonga]